MSKMQALISLVRPVNTAIAALSVLLIPAISIQSFSGETLRASLLAVLSVMLIAGAGNAINDYYDVETDRINKPERVLVTGDITPRTALLLWLFLSATGLVFSAMLGPLCFMIASTVFVLLWLYSRSLKRTMLLGNALVSIIGGVTFLYAGLAIGDPRVSIIPAIFATVFHFGREILKDMEDVEGDRNIGAATLPLRKGFAVSRFVVTGVFALLLLLTPVPYLTGWYGKGYALTIGCLLFPIVVYTLVSLHTNSSSPDLHRLNTLLKAAMVIGLFSIWAG